MKHITYYLIAALLVQSCATSQSKDNCLSNDWKQTGYENGFEANDIEKLAAFEKICLDQSIVVNREQYVSGYNEGLKKYCSTSHFFFRGELGWSILSNRCPAEQQSKLNTAFNQGKQLYQNKQRSKELEKRITEVHNDKSFIADLGRVKNLLGGDSPTKELDNELILLRKEIFNAENNSPDAAEYCEYEVKQKEKIQKIVPQFLLSMSPVVQENLNGCSRAIK